MCSRWAESAPSEAPIMSSGASTPPEVPEPSEKAHISDLKTMTPKTSASVACPASRIGDVVVADAEAAREEEAADTDAEAADGGPPHPVHGELAEEVFEAVHHAAQGGGGESDDHAEHAAQSGESDAAGDGRAWRVGRAVRRRAR